MDLKLIVLLLFVAVGSVAILALGWSQYTLYQELKGIKEGKAQISAPTKDATGVSKGDVDYLRDSVYQELMSMNNKQNDLRSNHEALADELKAFKSTYKNGVKDDIRDGCERNGPYWIDGAQIKAGSQEVGAEKLDTCTEICKLAETGCLAGILTVTRASGPKTPAEIIACESVFSITQTDTAWVSCLCCH